MQDQGINPDFKVGNEIIIEGAEPIMKPFVEYEAQEFNPFYYTQSRMSKWFIDKARSNEWNLRLKFENYFNEFEDSIFAISKKVKELEQDLLL